MSLLVLIFAGLAVSETLTNDPERAIVAAILALTFAVMRLQPGTIGRMWRAELDKAERGE